MHLNLKLNCKSPIEGQIVSRESRKTNWIFANVPWRDTKSRGGTNWVPRVPLQENKSFPSPTATNYKYTVCMKLLCKLFFLKLLQLECTNCFQNFTWFKKLRSATYSKVSIISASHFDTHCLKIPNKVSEYIMQIVLKGCVWSYFMTS